MSEVPDFRIKRTRKLIVYHSMPDNPCPDALCATWLEVRTESIDEIFTYPYTRSRPSFEQLRDVYLQPLKDCEKEDLQLHIVYVDISPEFAEEVEILKDLNRSGVIVKIKDHHKPNDTVGKLLEETTNTDTWLYDFEELLGGASVVYKTFPKEKKTVEIDQVLALIHFSEYEGMNPTEAKLDDAVELAIAIAKEHGITDLSIFELQATNAIRPIRPEVVLVYFLLDALMPKAFSGDQTMWKFLYEKHTIENKVELSAQFAKCADIYFNFFTDLLKGKKPGVFAPERLHTYQELNNTAMKILLKKAKTIKMKINEKEQVVLVAEISIVKYGRTLEVLLREAEILKKAQFAICVNPKKVTYYLSLRCVDVDDKSAGTARNLAEDLKKQGFCKIAGGHNWASGATFTVDELQNFLTTFGIRDLLSVEV